MLVPGTLDMLQAFLFGKGWSCAGCAPAFDCAYPQEAHGIPGDWAAAVEEVPQRVHCSLNSLLD